jgi:predicted acylesterase/phospholipase RssA
VEADRIGLALSGGGYRAAAFHLGVLRGLHAASLLERVEVVSAVSGGALLAAAWVMHAGDLEAFTSDMRRFLGRDLKWRVLRAALRPDRLARLMFSPRASLTEVLADVLDRELFHGATLGGLQGRRPRLILNATCVNHGTGWRFTPERMGDWILATQSREVLDTFPLARAVACSAAFPGGFAPVVLEGARHFRGAAAPPREVLLTDGGVDDNLGVQALLAERCTSAVVSDGSYPFVTDTRPLDRFGLPYPRRLLVAAAVAGLAAWGAARLDVPALALAFVLLGGLLALLRLRFALFLFGSVVMRGQRRSLLRRLFGGAEELPVTYLGLGTALEEDSERELLARGVDLGRLRRVRTDLALRPAEVDGLIALGETLARERLRRET